VNTIKLNRIQYYLVLVALFAFDACLGLVVPPAKFVWNMAGTVSAVWQNAGTWLDSKRNRKNASTKTSDSDEFDALPRAIARVSLPDGLSADEYLKLGKQYKQNGWITLSQDSLARAQELAPDTATATDARRYLLTKVPKPRVTLEVEQRNLEGYHFMAKRNLPKAREVFEGLMHDYPNFEWPYLNLATAYYRDGQMEQAKFLLRKLLSINPDHAEAWDILARIYAAELDIPEAQNAVAKALELYPEDNNIKTLIDCLAALN